MRTSRHPSLVLATSAVLALTAACNGGGTKGSGATPTPTSTATALTSEQATALAAAGVLTDADMPGFTGEAQTQDADHEAAEARLASCLGLGAPSYVARDLGRSFTKGDLEVHSTADVVGSAAQAQEELAAFTGAKAEPCFKAELTKAATASGGSLTSFDVSPREVSVQHVDDAFFLRSAFTIATPEQTFRLEGYELGAAVGQVEVSISVVGGAGSLGLTPDDAVALLERVAERVRAAE